MSLSSVPQNTCPLCRQPALNLSESSWRCRACGGELEFDPPTRRSRIVHFPDEFAAIESAVGSSWLSRREMFERVDAAQKALANAETDSSQTNTRWLGPALIVALTLLVLCVILGAVASAFVLSPSLARSRRAISAAYQPTAPASLTQTATSPSTAVATAAAVDSPLAITATAILTEPTGSVSTSTATPSAPITATAQPAPSVPPPATALPVLNSPLPAPQATLPPTFTPAAPTLPPPAATGPTATVTSNVTLAPVATQTPTGTAPVAPVVTTVVVNVTAPPTVQPPPAPPNATATPTIPLGSVIFPGATYSLRVKTVRSVGSGPQQADEYVELVNEGSQPAYIDGWSLKAIRSSDEQIIDTYLFQNGAIIAAGQTCRIYTNVVTSPADDCGFSGGFASSEPLWPDNGGARASLFNQGNVEQARYSF